MSEFENYSPTKYYLVRHRAPNEHVITFDEILDNFDCDMSIFHEGNHIANCTYTYRTTAKIGQYAMQTSRFKRRIRDFLNKYADILNKDTATEYRTFYIPKKKGGFRRIDAPSDRMKEAQKELREIMEELGLLHHTSAFAYVAERSGKDAVMKHKDSKWFYQADFHNFFGSITKDWTFKILEQIWPIAFVIDDNFKKAMEVCFLNGVLPQGSIISPALTNWLMIPFDYTITNLLKNEFVYTRYADDIQISCIHPFNRYDMRKKINDVLKFVEAPFHMAPEKESYGNNAGKNFMLGLIVNKEGNVTVGWRAKKELKAAVCNMLGKYVDGVLTPDELRHVNGLISYQKEIDKEYTEYFVSKLEEKFGVTVKQIVKEML